MNLGSLDLLPRYATAANLRLEPTTPQRDDLADFKRRLPSGWPRYAAVGKIVDLPPVLIAAIHWRESGLFDTYLAQGDTLGAPAVHEPTDQPVRGLDEWDLAAQDALSTAQQRNAKEALGLTFTSTIAESTPGMLAFAEVWNGTGYARKDVPSPYCLAGTTGYEGGKYVADGVYDPSAHDAQIGVLPMLWAARELGLVA